MIAGDSRALLRRRRGDLVLLTRDHVPGDAVEKARIVAAGGEVTRGLFGDARVNGRVNMSRAFGDHVRARLLLWFSGCFARRQTGSTFSCFLDLASVSHCSRADFLPDVASGFQEQSKPSR